MNLRGRYIAVFLLAATVAFLSMIYASAGNERIIGLYPDNEGCFYILSESNGRQYLEMADANVRSERKINNNAEFAVSGRGRVYLLSYSKGRTIVIPENKHGDEGSVIIDGFLVKEHCFEVDDDGLIYAVSIDDDRCIYVFDRYARLLKTVGTSSKISSLFYCEVLNRVFALTAGGITDAAAGKEIKCSIPSGEYQLSSDICTDVNGNVFRLDEQKGFVLLYRSRYNVICPSADGIYVSEGKNIYLLDESGNPIKSFEAGTGADRLICSGNNIGYYSDNMFFVLNKAEMKRIEKSPEAEESKKRKTAPDVSSDEPAAQSPVEKQESDIGIIDDKAISLNGRFLFIDKSMTVSEFKKAKGITDASVRIFDHNGRQTTSGHIGTGWKIAIPNDGTQLHETVLIGDVTGEGNINSSDISRLSDYILGKTDLGDSYAFAADIDENGVIDLRDLFMLYKKTL